MFSHLLASRVALRMPLEVMITHGRDSLPVFTLSPAVHLVVMWDFAQDGAGILPLHSTLEGRTRGTLEFSESLFLIFGSNP